MLCGNAKINVMKVLQENEKLFKKKVPTQLCSIPFHCLYYFLESFSLSIYMATFSHFVHPTARVFTQPYVCVLETEKRRKTERRVETVRYLNRGK